jgi:PPM family protein phosphatase
VRVYVGSGSDQGRIKKSNQDSVGVDPASGLFLIADGVGGHAGGDIASGIIVTLAKERVAAAKTTYQDRKAALVEAIREANSRIFEIAISQDKRGMSSTVTAFLIGAGGYFAASVGDSRAYLIRGSEIHQITKDHSFVQQLVDRGVITFEEARSHERRNEITRAVGLDAEVDIDTFEGEFRETDALLACSDGLWEEVTDKEILGTVLNSEDGQQACNALIEQANAKGGHDNISVVLAQSTPTMSRAAPRERGRRVGRGSLRSMPGKKVLIGAVVVVLLGAAVPLLLRLASPSPPYSVLATFATKPETVLVTSVAGGCRETLRLESGKTLLLHLGDTLHFRWDGFRDTDLVVADLSTRYYSMDLASRPAPVVDTAGLHPSDTGDTIHHKPQPAPSAKVVVRFMPGGGGKDARGAEVFVNEVSKGHVPWPETLERAGRYKVVLKFKDGVTSQPLDLNAIRDPKRIDFTYFGKDFRF